MKYKDSNYKKAFSAFLVLLLVVSVASVLDFVFVPPVYSQIGARTLNVQVEKEYYFIEQNVTITVFSNVSNAIQLSILNPSGTPVYVNSVYPNTTVTYSIPSDAEYGLYLVECGSVTTWFWLQNIERSVEVSLPYTWNWKNINYTLTEAYDLQVESSSGSFTTEWLSEINTKLKPDNRVFVNDHLVLVESSGKDITATSWMMNQFQGLKIRLNGTLASPTTLKWNMKDTSSDILWGSSSLKLGSLTYDWSDFDTTGVTYTLDKTDLKMDVFLSTSFDIDPVIFEDGFESGDVSEWTGTILDGGTVTVVDTGSPYAGTYHAFCDITVNQNDQQAAVYKNITEATTIFYSGWYKPSGTLPINNGMQLFGKLQADDSGTLRDIVELRIKNDGGTMKWKLGYRHTGTSFSWVISEEGLTPALDNLYHIEVECILSNTVGVVRMWVNETELSDVTQTGLNNDDYGGIVRVESGVIYASWRVDTAMYIDNLIVADEYQGMGETGDSTPPTYSSLSISTTVAGASCQFNATFNDETALEASGQYQFGTNNTGAWVWEDAVNFTATPQTISVSKTLNSTIGQVVGYQWNFTDNAQNSNTTGIQTLTTTSNYYSYAISISSDPSFVYQGETVTLTVSMTRDGAPFTDYIMNVTKDGTLWKQNVVEANSTFTDQSTTATSHTYSVSSLYDSDIGETVDYSVTPITVYWNIFPAEPPSDTEPVATGYNVTVEVKSFFGQPIEGAYVLLASQENYTNSRGIAAFEDVEAGNYTIKTIYQDRLIESELQVEGDTAKTVTVPLTQDEWGVVGFLIFLGAVLFAGAVLIYNKSKENSPRRRTFSNKKWSKE